MPGVAAVARRGTSKAGFDRGEIAGEARRQRSLGSVEARLAATVPIGAPGPRIGRGLMRRMSRGLRLAGEYVAVGIVLLADKPGQFGQRVVVVMMRTAHLALEIVEIDRRTLLGHRLAHTQTLARRRPPLRNRPTRRSLPRGSRLWPIALKAGPSWKVDI